jgi:transposase
MPAVNSKCHSHMSGAERKLMVKLRNEGKKQPEIARLLDFDPSVISRQLAKVDNNETPVGAGRKPALTPTQKVQLVKKARAMIKKAKAESQVTIGMVKDTLDIECCDKTALEALHEAGFYFKPLREKLDLSDEDIVARKEFADEYDREQNVTARSVVCRLVIVFASFSIAVRLAQP